MQGMLSWIAAVPGVARQCLASMRMRGLSSGYVQGSPFS
jgi:hypothetical protein